MDKSKSSAAFRNSSWTSSGNLIAVVVLGFAAIATF